MDQIDHFMSVLRQKFGFFTVIQNPATGASWPAEAFIKLVVTLLWAEERAGQLETYFEAVQMCCLRCRADAREFFVERAEEEGIILDTEYPRPVSFLGAAENGV